MSESEAKKRPRREAGGSPKDLTQDNLNLTLLSSIESAIREAAFMQTAGTIYAGYLAKDKAARHSDDELLIFAVDDALTLKRRAARHGR